MKILGIESSCDETAAAVVEDGKRPLSNVVHSQIDIHAEYGGVVPELASRDHIRRVLPLLREALVDAGMTMADIDGIAYTAGPGLIGALLTGASIARSMAWGKRL